MEAFRETLNFCYLHDIGFIGLPWIYDNCQHGVHNVRVVRCWIGVSGPKPELDGFVS
jgi:hypothetical protein